MAETIKLDLDPKKVLASLNQISESTKDLARTIEEQLGKDSAKSFDKLTDAAEKGTSKIGSFFKNLGTRVKEDLKTAFDVTGVLAGGKFAKELGKGVQGVFDMERAFDRLNTRLRLTQTQFSSFKTDLGRKAASTGQTLESILPGVEATAARGGLTNPTQLADVGQMLGQAKATTGEDTENLADTVVEILKTQGKKVTSESFREVLDALQATRTASAFRTATEAGQSIEGISPYAKRLGLNTREIGGLSAQASQAGSAGTGILQDFLRMAADKNVDRKKLEGIFGVDLFKSGKFNAQSLGNIDLKRFKGLSQEKFAEIGFGGGANGGDFVRFVEAFKHGTQTFQKLTHGSNETAEQFQAATNNLASKIDRFKQRTMEAGREIGEGLSGAANSLLEGDYKGALDKGKGTLSSVKDNAGTIAGALGATAAVGILTGGSLKRLLGSVGGLGEGLAKGELAKAAGVQPVYVVNAKEIGGGAGGLLGGAANAAGLLGKFGGLAKGALGVGAAFEGGRMIGGALNEIPAVQEAAQTFFDSITKLFGGQGIMTNEGAMAEAQKQYGGRLSAAPGGGGIKEAVAQGIETGMQKATVKVEQKGPYTNPSSVRGRGGPR
jgi:hypothetical protein